MIKGGYILLARKIIDSEIWKKPPLYLKVWVFLLTKAQYKPYRNLQKGQLFTSISEICESCAWNVGYRRVKPSKDSVFKVLDWMRKTSFTKATMNATMKESMIATAKATQGMLVTIDKYCVYQDSKFYESNDESNDESNYESDTIPNNINKEDKKNKKKEEKNTYGCCQNVFLTQAEYDRLKSEFPLLADSAIEFLSSYIVEKGYKTKDHNKTIRRWVIDAVSKKQPANKVDFGMFVEEV